MSSGKHHFYFRALSLLMMTLIVFAQGFIFAPAAAAVTPPTEAEIEGVLTPSVNTNERETESHYTSRSAERVDPLEAALAYGEHLEEKANQPDPVPVVVPAQPASTDSVWDELAECESGNDWSISTGNGYYGGLQFDLSTWRAVGGSGYPNQASKEEQIHRAEILRDTNGGYGAWPQCAAELGLL